MNRLQSITSTTNGTSISVAGYTYSYNDANQRTRANLADGSFWIYEYDSLGQVKSGKRYWSDWTPVAGQQFEYSFDDIGNRNSTKNGGDSTGGHLRSASYTNNTLNQITGRDVPSYLNVIGAASATATNVNVNNTHAYRKGEYYRVELNPDNTSAAVWQSVTNRVVQNGITNSVTGNLFLPKQAEVFSYDADGNLTNDGRWSYRWDAENRLVSMSTPTTAPSGSRKSLTFDYDPQGRRISKVVRNWTGSTWAKVIDEKYLYDGWNQLTTLNASNTTVVRAFLWGSDFSGSMQGAGGVGGLLAVNAKGSGVAFVACDGNGNVTALVDAALGNTVANYEYGPFGEVLRASGTLAKLNPFRFSTKFQDEETDHLYYGYRYYSQSTGRWPNRDPMGENGGLNLYGFVGNNPMGFVDSLGLYEIDVHYYLTYWLASKIPCFTDAEAKQIANADQGTDENPDTKPGLGSTEKQREQNRKYHALHPPGDGQNYLGELWGDATERPIFGQRRYSPSDPPMQMRRNCDLNALGIYLHHLQDTFSHRGFESDVYGHARRIHGNDKTADDYAKSAQMAAATWNALQDWVKICRCQCYSDKLNGKNLFVYPMGQQLTDFLKASGGPARREINQEEIDRKRGIIGVDPR